MNSSAPPSGSVEPTSRSGFISKLGIGARKPVAVPAAVSAASRVPLSTCPSDEATDVSAMKEQGVAVGPSTTASSEEAHNYNASRKEEAGLPAAVVYSKPTLTQRFDAKMPAHRRYLGRSRRTFLLIILAAFLCLLALILGLAIGLSRKGSGGSQNLPLPSNNGIFTGDLTYYANELGLGSCGWLSAANDNICAVSHLVYDAASTSSNPNANPLCGKMIRVTRYDATSGGNKSVDVKVIDRCVGCKADDLDLSIGAFEKVADEAQGRVVGSWAWLN